MITEQDMKTIETISYLVEDLKPAIKEQVNLQGECWNCGYGQVENNDRCGTIIKNDLRLIRRLALNIRKNL